MKKTLQILLAAIAVIISTNAKSQEYVKQIIAIEGAGVESYVSSYNPQTGLTTIFDTIAVPYVQDVVVDSNFAYVAANDSLVMYNIDTYERVNIVALKNPHLMKIYNNKLIVGRWTSVTASDSAWVKIYDKSNLSLITDIIEVDDQTFGITIANDSAYIAVNGGYGNAIGKIAVIDMQNNAFVRYIDYGTQGEGIGNLFNDGTNVYTVNETYNWNGDTVGAIGTYDINAGTTTFDTYEYKIGRGYFVNGANLFLGVNDNIAVYNLSTHNFTDTTIIAKPAPSSSYTSVKFDRINNIIYVAETNYWSYGYGFTFDLSGNTLDTFDLGISVTALAIDYRTPVNINDKFAENSISVYPNPASTYVQIESGNLNVESFAIFDIYGRNLTCANPVRFLKPDRVDISNLPKGIYFIKLSTDKGIITKKIIKQ